MSKLSILGKHLLASTHVWRKVCAVVAFMWLCSLSVVAQVPKSMDYQILAINPKTGLVWTEKELEVRVELRLNAEDGQTVWSTDQNVKSSRTGVCTIPLNFSGVDWTLGTYYIKAFVNGEPIGASQVKSVPFALIADGVSGVITKSKLIGTWFARTVKNNSGATVWLEYTFTFNKDGSFVYSIKSEYGHQDRTNTGKWKLNNLGYLLCEVDGYDTKVALPTVYDNEDKGLCICDVDGTAVPYETITYYKKE